MTDQFRTLVESIVVDVLSKLQPMRPAANDEYLSTADAAKLARVTPGTIRRWVRSKRLRRHGDGVRVRVRRAELERVLSGAPSNETPEEKARKRFG